MEYSFHNRKKKVKNPQLNTKPVEKKSQIPAHQTKQVIMDQYAKYESLKDTNPKVKYLSDTQESISKQIVDGFTSLQQCQDPEESGKIQSKLNHLNDLHKKLKEEYTEILRQELDVLYENWPEIFDKVIEGVDRETLSHVLSVYDAVQSGQLNSDEALNQGMDFMTMKYGLPTDFFNRGATDQFNKQFEKYG